MTSKSQQPSDSPVPASDAKPIAEEEAGSGTKVTAPDPVAQLQADLEAAKAEAEQCRDRFLRKAAELENFRKRSDRERMEASALIKSSVLIEFLPIVDACERALESFKVEDNQPGKVQKYREGVELLYKQLGNTLTRMGVVPFEAAGQKFDPHKHEALSHLETDEYEENTVVQELRRGYLLKDRLLRPAQVVVASRPKPREEGQAKA